MSKDDNLIDYDEIHEEQQRIRLEELRAEKSLLCLLLVSIIGSALLNIFFPI